MAPTISIFDRWTARAKNGIWAMLEGPTEVATALNAIAEPHVSSIASA
jgi:hypothetical protein